MRSHRSPSPLAADSTSRCTTAPVSRSPPTDRSSLTSVIPTLIVYPRSCLKPMQAHAMVGLGLELPDELLAVACASHDGTPMHLDAVRAILARHGLDDSALRNTPAPGAE